MSDSRLQMDCLDIDLGVLGEQRVIVFFYKHPTIKIDSIVLEGIELPVTAWNKPGVLDTITDMISVGLGD